MMWPDDDTDEKPKSFSDDERLARLRLVRSDSIGPITYKKLLARYGTALKALDQLAERPDLAPRGFKLASLQSIEQELAAAALYGAVQLFLGESAYPRMLAAIPDPPPVITLKGNMTLLALPSIGIVGARHASASGIKLTRHIATDLASNGYVVTSGLARGIDTAAHKAALKGGTLACLAGGLNTVYPPENTALHQAIGETGLLISEMAMGTVPQARHFPRRNRLISGLSLGILVVEAAERSGSLITARMALEQGRDVFAVPGSPLDPRSEGTNRLIREGAMLTRTADDIQEAIGFVPENAHMHTPAQIPLENAQECTLDVQRVHSEKTPPKTLSKREPILAEKEDIVALLSSTPIHLDEIVRLSGTSAKNVLSAFLPLEMTGKIIRHSGNRFSLISTKNE